jgi:hypothetical protein
MQLRSEWNGIEPAPERSRKTRWKGFLNRDWQQIVSSDFRLEYRVGFTRCSDCDVDLGLVQEVLVERPPAPFFAVNPNSVLVVDRGDRRY